jgi:deazaflavin-dependent oxidoreductase (nitroreductase family)
MGLLTPIAVRLGRTTWMPKLLPQVVWLDKRLAGLTRGRFTVLDIAGLPNVTLSVPGRKSGIPRTTPLLAIPYEDGWLIAGSYFGAPHAPAWVENLRATEKAGLRVSGEEFDADWRELEGEERARAWQAMLEHWPNYTLYEQRSNRKIPVFHLTRA